MKYVILNIKIVNDIDSDQLPIKINYVTLKIADDFSDNDFVAFSSNDYEKVSDFYTMLKLGYKGLPNVVLSLA